jgi:hypothetical protein
MRPENDPDDLSMLPAAPPPEKLLKLYQLCRKKLVFANRSRSSLQGHDNRRRRLIMDLREQLEDLEMGFQNEASTRAMLHQLNERVASIMREYESGVDEATEIIEERSSGGLSDWVAKLARLLPVVMRLRELRERSARLLGREAAAIPFFEEAVNADSLIGVDPAPLGPEELPSDSEPASIQAPTPGKVSEPQGAPPRRTSDGPLLLQDLEYAFGLLLLHGKSDLIPVGFKVETASSWLIGEPLIVPVEPIDPDFAPIEAGVVAISSEESLFPILQPWLSCGILPFATDPRLQLPRLIQLDQASQATHVLVREEYAAVLQEAGAATLSLDLDEDLWHGFALDSEEERQTLLGLLRSPGQKREELPRLSTRGGVRLQDGHGYLATGLGLPLLAIPMALKGVSVQLKLVDGQTLVYEQLVGEGTEAGRQFWQPKPDNRQQADLPIGPACFRAELEDGSELSRTIQLNALPVGLQFQRARPLDYREDWGLNLGSIVLPRPVAQGQQPSVDSLAWAWQLLHQVDFNVNHLFEHQMLESLAALFQRRASIPRRDFFDLYAQLRNKPDEWPGFPEAVLRGWCEGGWLEEGLERSSGLWRIQPVDPRLVRLERGGAQLVGLLSARGLLDLLALAHQLGLEVRSVPPTCPDMPRGWRFHGDADQLARAYGLPMIDQEKWAPDPRASLWILDTPCQSDSPPWPLGLKTRVTTTAVCGRRGLDHHWMPAQPFPEGGRAPVSLKIQAEASAYGKRRWLSRDPVSDSVFVSCHRNRVALHALVVATNGLWPFGFTDPEIGQLDRLYDADVYLPLPLGRYLALTGSKMPGPTRYQPSDHTYRYSMDLSLRVYHSNNRLLPLTVLP